MWPQEFHVLVKHEQFQDQLVAAQHARLVAAFHMPPHPVLCSAAEMLGRGLLWLGLVVLRYGRDESAVSMRVPSPSPRAIKLN